MNYFTAEKYVALQRFDRASMNAADAEWDRAVSDYATHLDSIRPELPESVRQLLEGHYLHDADVLSAARQGANFTVLLQLDSPPHELLTITYALTAPPQIIPDAIPPEHASPGMQWLFDELAIDSADGERQFEHSILFSKGWGIHLNFHDVTLYISQPVHPVRRLPLEHVRDR